MKSNPAPDRPTTDADGLRPGTPGEVFGAFLKLGLTSFGGPVAHLGYFRDELVTRRRWVNEKAYGDLVTLCQFLPGPASSQVGFALGLHRAGPIGALAAFVAFTLPSALMLLAFAYGASAFGGPIGQGVVAGLKIVAVAIVAQAVWGMSRSFCPDRTRAAIALAAVLAVTMLGGIAGQVGAIVVGALAGLLLLRGMAAAPAGGAATPSGFGLPKRAGIAALAAFAILLFVLPLAAGSTGGQALVVFDAFYRAGALVFGGGHVVLPLLEAQIVSPGWVPADAFVAGYGAAQAMPGPLFSFAAYLGALVEPGPNGVAGALIALCAIFLPGFLILVGVLPFWDALAGQRSAQAAMLGANAAVVGILGAALYDPVFTSAVDGPPAFALALTCLLLLTLWKATPWLVVIAGALGGIAIVYSA